MHWNLTLQVDYSIQALNFLLSACLLLWLETSCIYQFVRRSKHHISPSLKIYNEHVRNERRLFFFLGSNLKASNSSFNQILQVLGYGMKMHWRQGFKILSHLGMQEGRLCSPTMWRWDGNSKLNPTRVSWDKKPAGIQVWHNEGKITWCSPWCLSIRHDSRCTRSPAFLVIL